MGTDLTISASHLICLASLAAFAVCLDAGAQTVAEPEDESVFSGEIGITVANQYITRGFVVQEGTSFQPHLDISASLYEGDGFINNASAFIGWWSAIGSTPYNEPGPGGSRFTEFDYGLGMSVTFAKRWTLSSYYNRWTSPAGAYIDGHWLNGTLEFDDHELFPGNFSLEPFVVVTHQFDEDLAPGLCFEPGIRPNVTFFPETSHSFNAGVLMLAGLGNGFYGVDYGYFAFGPQLSVPLSFMDLRAGKWTLFAECLYYDFGETTTLENGREKTWYASLKLSVSF